MRVNNSKVKGLVISTYFLLIVMALILSTVFSVFKEIDVNPILIFVGVVFTFLVLFVFVFRITKFFEYDSDGLKVGIMNKGLLSTDSLKSKEHTLEIDKEKLVSFKFQNFIVYKRLVLSIINHRGHKKKEIFNVTLVARKKRKYVKQSLNKIVRKNRKQIVDDRRE
jgi:hypothetical protein